MNIGYFLGGLDMLSQIYPKLGGYRKSMFNMFTHEFNIIKFGKKFSK